MVTWVTNWEEICFGATVSRPANVSDCETVLMTNKNLNCSTETKYLVCNGQSRSCCGASLKRLGADVCRLSPSSLFSDILHPLSPLCLFILCLPFVICGAVICEVSRTRRPVCFSWLVVAGIKCGRLQMYGTWVRVSRAAERMCPAWQGPPIYGVDVPLHYGPEMKRFPCSFVQHPPYPECTPSLPFLLSLRPILLVLPLDGHLGLMGVNSGSVGVVSTGQWMQLEGAVLFALSSKAFIWYVKSKQPGHRRSSWGSLLAQPQER